MHKNYAEFMKDMFKKENDTTHIDVNEIPSDAEVIAQVTISKDPGSTIDEILDSIDLPPERDD